MRSVLGDSIQTGWTLRYRRCEPASARDSHPSMTGGFGP